MTRRRVHEFDVGQRYVIERLYGWKGGALDSKLYLQVARFERSTKMNRCVGFLFRQETGGCLICLTNRDLISDWGVSPLPEGAPLPTRSSRSRSRKAKAKKEECPNEQ